MSKKFRAGRRKSQIKPNVFSKKRRAKSIRKFVHDPAIQPNLFYDQPECCMCGKEIMGLVCIQDGRNYCSLCLMVWNG